MLNVILGRGIICYPIVCDHAMYSSMWWYKWENIDVWNIVHGMSNLHHMCSMQCIYHPYTKLLFRVSSSKMVCNACAFHFLIILPSTKTSWVTICPNLISKRHCNLLELFRSKWLRNCKEFIFRSSVMRLTCCQTQTSISRDPGFSAHAGFVMFFCYGVVTPMRKPQVSGELCGHL